MEKIIVLDLGSPATEYIARSIRQIGVYSEIIPHLKYDNIREYQEIRGLVISVLTERAADAEALYEKVKGLSLPVFMLLYSEDLAALESQQNAPGKLSRLCFGKNAMASYALDEKLRSYLFDILGLKPKWNAKNFIAATSEKLRREVGDKQVILGLSGGVDSSVVAALLHRVIGTQLKAIFVDTGLMRFAEKERVQQSFAPFSGMHISYIDASELFLGRLKGVCDPEEKRKIIGHTFIEVFERVAAQYPDAKYLAQGTLYPDVIESVGLDGKSLAVKSHHNVGALPKYMQLKLLEPLRELFKDEVRAVGRELGLSAELVDRHPFPGPGLAVRILGEITKEKVKTLQKADEIFISELRKNNLYHCTWQAFAVLLPIKSVGLKNGKRHYGEVCALRAVNSVDGLTAEISPLPLDFLSQVAERISNEVDGISRVVFDISGKPPATIEWE